MEGEGGMGDASRQGLKGEADQCRTSLEGSK